MQLSLVIPCLDEERTISACVRGALDALAAAGVAGEVIVVDNASVDQTAAHARAAGATVVRCEERGYGAAIRCGIAAARWDHIMIMDGDLSYDLAELSLFLRAIEDLGARIVVGSRLSGCMEPGSMPWLHRYVGTPVLTALINLVYGTRLSDATSGLRYMERATFDSLETRTTGFQFIYEMLVQAARRGVPVHEVPISFHRDGRARPPHLRTWRDGWWCLRVFLDLALR
jgi:glycosyltransferase involved in cell wall biosynthesis